MGRPELLQAQHAQPARRGVRRDRAAHSAQPQDDGVESHRARFGLPPGVTAAADKVRERTDAVVRREV